MMAIAFFWGMIHPRVSAVIILKLLNIELANNLYCLLPLEIWVLNQVILRQTDYGQKVSISC
jgi:hypothetical protein